MKSRAALQAALVVLVTFLTGCALVVAPPRAEFDVRPPVVYSGDRVDLNASASAGDLVNYEWDVNGGVEHGRIVTTTFPHPGAYLVRLTVEDSHGREATAEREVTVYARSGTRLFAEEFSDGDVALGRWPVDPTWAVPGESRIATAPGETGYSLFVDSEADTYHRRGARLDMPPLRVGQKLVFSVRVMPLRTQGQCGFVIAPGRSTMTLPAAGLPYYVFSGTLGGSAVREPSAAGGEVSHFVSYLPPAYEWHTYTLSYEAGAYSLLVDGIVWSTGTMDVDLGRGGTAWLVLGDESLTEACQTYYDSILVSVEE